MKIGQWYRLKNALGDHHQGKSVTVPAGWPARLVALFSGGLYDYAKLEVFNPPGCQQVFTTAIHDFPNIWDACCEGWEPHKGPDGWRMIIPTRFERADPL